MFLQLSRPMLLPSKLKYLKIKHDIENRIKSSAYIIHIHSGRKFVEKFHQTTLIVMKYVLVNPLLCKGKFKIDGRLGM